MGICSQRMLKDVDKSDEAVKPRGAAELLAELTRVDLKSKAEGR